MSLILIILLLGVLFGLSVRKISILFKLNERVFTLMLYLLFFIIAVSTGMEDIIDKDIESIGWTTFLLMVLASAGIILIYSIFYNILSRRETNDN